MTERLPVVVVGAGAMGREWIRLLSDNPHARVVGIVDLDVPLAERAAADLTPGAVVGSGLNEVAERAAAAAVINVTVPHAHRPINEQALRAGLPVLCEKPIAATLAEAIRQVAVANVTGQLLMVSQSRRYFNHLTGLRDAVARGGALAAVTQEFFHADHEPGFREQMAHPLLVDMSIHHFDAVRYATGDEAVSVECSSWNPAWSWYRGDACATASFQLRSGARFIYSGSRCTPGLQTSFNAQWRVQSERGAVGWDGETTLTVDIEGVQPEVPQGEEGLRGSLAEFVAAIRGRRTPQNEVRDNILSLAMVEAAIASSADHGRRIVLDDLLEEAYRVAMDEEPAEDTRQELGSWTDLRIALSTGHWGSDLRHLTERVTA